MESQSMLAMCPPFMEDPGESYSLIIQKKTKHSLPLLSREQEVGLESVAEGAVDFEMVLIFNCFSLTFCIILHKK